MKYLLISFLFLSQLIYAQSIDSTDKKINNTDKVVYQKLTSELAEDEASYLKDLSKTQLIDQNFLTSFEVTVNTKNVSVPEKLYGEINARRAYSSNVLWKVNDDLEILIYPNVR